MEQKTKVVIFNGPPGSGKDEAVLHLKMNHVGIYHFEFKRKLIALLKLIFDVTDEQWEYLYTRERKELASPMLGGLSPRQALIHVSENIIKPAFGKSYFGERALFYIQNLEFESEEEKELTIFVASDGGFIEELSPFIDKFEQQLIVVRIHRDGCDFRNDSRSYIPDMDMIRTYDIYNAGDPSYYAALDKLYNKEIL